MDLTICFIVGVGRLILLVFWDSEDFLILISNCSTKFLLYLSKTIIQSIENTVHNLVG